MHQIATPQVGSIVKPDEWKYAEQLVPSDWDLAPFRLTTGRWTTYRGAQREMQLAVRVEVTGRTLQQPFGREGGHWVRARITFIGDGEPDTQAGGWVRADKLGSGEPYWARNGEGQSAPPATTTDGGGKR